MRKFTIVLALLLLAGLQGVLAQTRVISGVVTSSEDKSPIPGVTIVVKSTTIGTVTNIDGKYVLSVPSKYDVLDFSYVGMKTKEVKIGESNTLDVVLEPDVMNMDEIVVTAIGIPRETKALSYSVQNVNAEDISRASQTDVINTLQGKVSDLQVISSSGVAGAASYIQVRGATSLTGNNQPLFVVDGVPIAGAETGGDIEAASGNNFDGVGLSNRAIDLNPDDIESVSVLKGGAATALYGLRAASGAIIITTKKGKATTGKKISVTFSTSVKFDVVSQLPARQDQYGQGSGGNWISGNKFSWGPKLDTCAYDKSNWSTYEWKDFDNAGRIVSNKVGQNGAINTYNPYNFFQTGLTTDNSIALSGGGDVSTFYFSFSDNQTKGIIPNNTMHRNTFKISGDTKLSEHWKVSGNANYIITSANRIQQGNNTSGIMLGLLRTPPTFDNGAGYIFSSDYLLPDGSQLPSAGFERSYRHGIYYDNPYWTANENHYQDAVNRLIGSAQVDYLANKWLSFTYRIGMDWYGRKIVDNLAVGSSTQPAGWAKRGEELSKNFNSDLFMTIDKNFAKDFNVHFILGQNMTEQFFTSLNSQALGLVIPNYYDLNNTASIASQESTSDRRGAGFYGDLTLSWKNMLYLTGTGRNDWSTTLPAGKNSFFYPSVGLGWIFTQLNGLKDNKVLPYGKVRVSYAITAKDAPPYSTFTPYTAPAIADGWTIPGLTWPFNGTNGFLLSSTLGNNQLKPEKTANFETGIDLKFIQNRIGISYTYFNNKTTDDILQVPIAASSGYTSVWLNAGSIRTTGHEVTLDLVPIKSKNWEWDVTFNWSKIDNKVLALAPGINRLYLGGFTGSEIDAVVGQPYRTIYGYDWERDKNGNVLIGSDGYPIESQNETALGNVDPKWTAGIGSTLRWKDLSLYFLVDIKHGGKMWDGTRGAMDYFGVSAGTLNRGEYVVFDGVLADGSKNTMKVPLSQDWYQAAGSGFVGATAPYIEDAGWVRLRTLTLTYNLSKFLKKTFIRQLSVYFTGTNLLVFDHYKGVDPETSLAGSQNAQGIDYFNMPGTKSYTLGLNVAF